MAGSNTKKKTTASGKTAGKKTAGTKTTAAKRTGTKKQETDSSFLQSEAVILGTFAVCVFLFLSNFHICGMLGDMFSSMLLGVFGSIGYVAPVLLFLGTIFYASNKGNIRAVYKMLAVEVLLIVLCGLAQLIFGGGYQEGQTFKEIYETAGESGMGGGVIGVEFEAQLLSDPLGFWAASSAARWCWRSIRLWAPPVLTYCFWCS